MRIAVYWIGKTRLPGVSSLTDEYAKRLKHYCEFAALEVRGGKRKSATVAGSTGLSAEEDNMIRRSSQALRVALDPDGRAWSSAEFAAYLGKQRDQGSRELAFCVGGADGFSPAFRKQAHLKFSLSPMTMPHELARVVLLEQLYRAFTILANHPYPR